MDYESQPSYTQYELSRPNSSKCSSDPVWLVDQAEYSTSLMVILNYSDQYNSPVRAYNSPVGAWFDGKKGRRSVQILTADIFTTFIPHPNQALDVGKSRCLWPVYIFIHQVHVTQFTCRRLMHLITQVTCKCELLCSYYNKLQVIRFTGKVSSENQILRSKWTQGNSLHAVWLHFFVGKKWTT